MKYWLIKKTLGCSWIEIHKRVNGLRMLMRVWEIKKKLDVVGFKFKVQELENYQIPLPKIHNRVYKYIKEKFIEAYLP